jgi:hypothetical protein
MVNKTFLPPPPAVSETPKALKYRHFPRWHGFRYDMDEPHGLGEPNGSV